MKRRCALQQSIKHWGKGGNLGKGCADLELEMRDLGLLLTD